MPFQAAACVHARVCVFLFRVRIKKKKKKKQTATQNWKRAHLVGIACSDGWRRVRRRVPKQAINEMKPLKYHAIGG